MPGPEVVGQLGVGGEGGGVQAGRAVVQLLAPAPLGQAEAFLVAARRVAAGQEGGELVPDSGHPLGTSELSLGVGVASGRVRWPSCTGDGLVQLALLASALPRLPWAAASFGSSAMAFL